MRESRFSVVEKSWDQPSTSHYISPIKILPSPKVTPTINKRKVRCQKSEILTSSPFKNTIEMKNEMKAKPKLVCNRTIIGKENKSMQIGTSKNKGKGKGKVKKTEKEINIVQNLDDFSENNVYCVGIMWRTLCGTAH